MPIAARLTLAEASPYSPFAEDEDYPVFDYNAASRAPSLVREIVLPEPIPEPVPEPEPEPLPVIKIYGEPLEGSVLEVVGHVGVVNPAAASFQWYVIQNTQWIPIAGATLATFIPTGREAGHFIGVQLLVDTRSTSTQTATVVKHYMNVAIQGEPKVGTVLRAAGTWPMNSSFQWYVSRAGGFSPILDATQPTYIPTRQDAGHPLTVVVSYLDQQTQATTAPVQKVEIDTSKYRVVGGPYHTNTLSFVGTYFEAEEGNSLYQWLHADTDDLYKSIPGAVNRNYIPSADDLHANLALDYTPVSLTGEKGPTFRVEVDSNFLAIDPHVASRVETVVKTGEGAFNAVYRPDNGGPEQSVVIEAISTKVTIRKSDGLLAKAPYSVDFGIYLSQNDNRAFRLILNKTDGYNFIVADHRERDVVALCIRSFLSLAVLLKGKIGVHRVQSLSELRHKQEEAKKKLGQ
eukprot:TRINITY_DN983_c0_g1_i1.p1 TRINITY_DN983_c0_g1~~TRINITY_DN983_c0_g1_i1.p1  ORF type:complete len:460 (-),score=87.58 TRINITY_DN983_c0_g1_i1:183-1562(-)